MRSLLLVGLLSLLSADFSLFAGDDQSKNPSVAGKASETRALTGIWEGTLSVPPGLELQFVVRVTQSPGGETEATLDIPDQDARGIPATSISLQGEEVTMTFKPLGAEYKGKRDKAGTAIAGKFKQGHITLPLSLKKVESVSERRRPQMPRPPFPYKVEDVTYPSKAAGVRLAGTLTIPEGKGPFPAVLLITGSGPQDRDETLVGHKPFLLLADALTRRRIAVLRFDDRGVARSTGNFATATSADFADDVEGGIAFLRERPEIDAKRIGLLGHSEGGVIGPMVAARVPTDVAFLVLMAGTGVSGETLAFAQQESMLRAAGAKDEDVKIASDLLKHLLPIVLHEKDSRALGDKLRAGVKGWIEKHP
jgi:uncharacterized protein